ncbi:MAG: hypothetical protein COT84_04395 [Chlamydiae bacterium CG10_big_fil_rev_8_21_14_0_10_35_9]|nr:MAG: hypothetical protein COT84_04395 [Chlamydiae bacterium CG10_big_fil_rev_8_21_14_0_10_35_9]
MITIERYKRALQDFANMDLGNSRVTFSREEFVGERIRFWVAMPKIEQKLHKIIQLLQQIFHSVFGKFFDLEPSRLDTVNNLNNIVTTINLFRGGLDRLDDAQLGFDLKNRVTYVAFQILQKIKRVSNSPENINLIDQCQENIRREYRFNRQLIVDEKDLEVSLRRYAECRSEVARNEADRVQAELTRAQAEIARLRNVEGGWIKSCCCFKYRNR